VPNKAPERKQKAEPEKQVLVISVATPAKMSKAKESGAVTRNCSCTSAFQDSRYGRGRRAFTCSKKNGNSCTVCGKKS
jgi:hypothetical protein